MRLPSLSITSMKRHSLSLSSSTFSVEVDEKTGGVHGLRNPNDPFNTNFVINPHQVPSFDVEDSRWLGDIVMHLETGNAEGRQVSTGLSSDCRVVEKASTDTVKVSYLGNSKNEGGLMGVDVHERYTLDGPGLRWSIEIENTSEESVQINDLGLSLLMNSFWENDQSVNYTERVLRHAFIAGESSYVYWQRPNGEGPFLIMLADSGTGLEYKERQRKDHGPYGEVERWEGASMFYIHSKHIVSLPGKHSYLPSTCASIKSGRSKRYGFSFHWVETYAEMRNVIYEQGGLDIISLPGMVVPNNTKVTLALRAQSGVTGISAREKDELVIAKREGKNGYGVFEFALPSLGNNDIVVSHGDRLTLLQYYSIEPIRKLIDGRAKFLAKHQVRDSDRGYNGAFLQWDMLTEKVLTWDNYPGGGWKEWMAGGSDDLGLAPAAYLSEKNVFAPVQSEISAIDYYINHFLFAYLQAAGSGGENGRSYQVYRWFDGQDGVPTDTGVWRCYNYTHIANTYLNMYRISKAFKGIKLDHSPQQYIDYCYQTLFAMFTKIPQPTPIGNAAWEMGLMGESTYPEILASLLVEDMQDAHDKLYNILRGKHDIYKSQEYPFGSEMYIDTTGFESTYTLASLFDNNALQHRTQRASLACRGMQPVWYWYGSDNRLQGDSWWNLGYETQLGAWQQQEYLQTASIDAALQIDVGDMHRSTYGSFLAGWANINSGQIRPSPENLYAAAWLFQSERGVTGFDWIPSPQGWWLWSGEADLGFWGGLRTSSVNVVDDPVLGVYTYGGFSETTSTGQTVWPTDGVRQRLTLYNNHRLSLRLKGICFAYAIIAFDRSCISVQLDSIADEVWGAVLTVVNIPKGAYTVTLLGLEKTMTTSNETLVIPIAGGRGGLLDIQRVTS